MKKDEMPPEEEKPRPTEEEIAVIRKWIKAGVPGHLTRLRRHERKSLPSAILDLIRADLEKAANATGAVYRYFTITHLYNVGRTEDELLSYRIAISKLVNSLSWGKRIVKPKPIDPDRTILRIDLRDVK